MAEDAPDEPPTDAAPDEEEPDAEPAKETEVVLEAEGDAAEDGGARDRSRSPRGEGGEDAWAGSDTAPWRQLGKMRSEVTERKGLTVDGDVDLEAEDDADLLAPNGASKDTGLVPDAKDYSDPFFSSAVQEMQRGKPKGKGKGKGKDDGLKGKGKGKKGPGLAAFSAFGGQPTGAALNLLRSQPLPTPARAAAAAAPAKNVKPMASMMNFLAWAKEGAEDRQLAQRKKKDGPVDRYMPPAQPRSTPAATPDTGRYVPHGAPPRARSRSPRAAAPAAAAEDSSSSEDSSDEEEAPAAKPAAAPEPMAEDSSSDSSSSDDEAEAAPAAPAAPAAAEPAAAPAEDSSSSSSDSSDEE